MCVGGWGGGGELKKNKNGVKNSKDKENRKGAKRKKE
jgi:hypothetical protein